MPRKTLNELKPKEKGKIIKIGGGGGIQRRLLDMGLVVGSEVEMERVAPLGDPVEVRIKGYHLSLRKEEAIKIEVEVQ
jgi:Fe2+ transport system protein FeoA